MKILAFSDLHHDATRAAVLVQASVGADLVIGAGDFCNMRQDLPGAMELLRDVAAPMLVIPGNAESAAELSAAADIRTQVLHGTDALIGGVRFFGLGYAVPAPPFGDWSCNLSEDEAERLLNRCEGADVLIVHSPPLGLGDRISGGASVGSRAVLRAIERLQPDLVLCGHIHDSWGVTGTIGRSKVVNLGPTPNWFEIGA